MKFTKLRLAGFKTFCRTGRISDRAGFHRHCRAERLRQIQSRRGDALGNGRKFIRDLRASGMGDVIFSGGGERPDAIWRRCASFLDNRERGAPAEL